MGNLRPVLIRLLAAVLFFQSGMALAHCLRGMPTGDGMLLEICSTEGMRTIRLDAGGNEAPEPAQQTTGGFCPLCHGLPDVALPEPTGLASRAWLSTAVTRPGDEADRFHPPARAPPYATRAPPITA